MRSATVKLVLAFTFLAAVLVLGPAPPAGGAEEDPPDPDVPHESDEHGDDHGDDGHGGSSGRLSCAAIDAGWMELALTGHPLSGHYTVADANRSVQFFVYDAPAGGKLVNWTSDGPINAVILRSGQDAATYEYEPPGTGGSGLAPALRDRDGRNLAAILACYEPVEVTIDDELALTDSEDPVAVGSEFEYRMSAKAAPGLADAEIVVTLSPLVAALTAPGCEIGDGEVRCAAFFDAGQSWNGVMTVSAVSAGDAVTHAELRGQRDGSAVAVSSVEVTRIVDTGHGGGGHGRDFTSACSAVAPGSDVLVLPGPFASRRYLVAGDNVEIWVTIQESEGHQHASWTSDVPVDAAITRTGQDMQTYPYSPPAYSGSGLVGPAGGSGPRPIADLAFCVVPRAPVDLGLSVVAPPGIPVDEESHIWATVVNSGYEAAETAELQIQLTGSLQILSCNGAAIDGSTCPMGRLEAGQEIEMLIGVVAPEVGTSEVTLTAFTAEEDPDLLLDNVATVSLVAERGLVAAQVASGTAPSPDPPSETAPSEEPPEELAFTGHSELVVLLLVLAAGLMTVGCVISKLTSIDG